MLSGRPSGWSEYQLAWELRFRVSKRTVPSGLHGEEGGREKGRRSGERSEK